MSRGEVSVKELLQFGITESSMTAQLLLYYALYIVHCFTSSIVCGRVIIRARWRFAPLRNFTTVTMTMKVQYSIYCTQVNKTECDAN